MRVPRFFPQLFAAVASIWKAPAAHSQIARLDAEVEKEEIVEGTGKGVWRHPRAPWRKFYKRRIARLAKHSRNLNRTISPRRRKKQSARARFSLSLGERAGVRASVRPSFAAA